MFHQHYCFQVKGGDDGKFLQVESTPCNMFVPKNIWGRNAAVGSKLTVLSRRGAQKT